MPVVSVTDLEVHGNDLVASTYGRALWILDDLSPIRAMSADKLAADVYLFPPATATRVRWDNFQDTPYPPETPAGKNPPDGAILDYFLKSPPAPSRRTPPPDSPAGDATLDRKSTRLNSSHLGIS